MFLIVDVRYMFRRLGLRGGHAGVLGAPMSKEIKPGTIRCYAVPMSRYSDILVVSSHSKMIVPVSRCCSFRPYNIFRYSGGLPLRGGQAGWSRWRRVSEVKPGMARSSVIPMSQHPGFQVNPIVSCRDSAISILFDLHIHPKCS